MLTGERRARAGLVTLVLAQVAACLIGAGSARASTQDENADGSPIRWSSDFVAAPRPLTASGAKAASDAQSRATWVWHEGRRAYRLLSTAASASQFAGFEEIASVDLDSGQELVRRPFPEGLRGWGGGNIEAFTRGQSHSAVVDQASGRIYVLYQFAPTAVDRRATRAVAGRCESPTESKCVAGVLGLNGNTLEVEVNIPFSVVRLEGAGIGPVVPIPRALTFVPAAAVGGEGKLLMTVEDHAVAAVSPPNAGNAATLGEIEQGRTFAMQLDVAGKTLDWVTPIEECRGQREADAWVGNSEDKIGARPGPGAILRAEDGAVWVGCFGDANQSEYLVRIPILADGRPVSGPAVPGTRPAPEVQQPDNVLGSAPERRQLFVGPRSAVEYLVDHGSGRVITRFVTARPLGEVWTVFDTVTRRFVGNVGTGAHPVAGTASPYANGYAAVDSISGRLYVLHHDAGLYVADIRRDPLPQALLFPEFRYAPGGDVYTFSPFPLVIDAGSAKAPRRILTLWDSDQYRVITDRLSVSMDHSDATAAAVSLDIDEQPGVTATSFDGVARGYGARALLIGGAEAAVRWKFADPMGWVQGGVDKNTNTDLGTVGKIQQQTGGVGARNECLEANREVVLGSVGPAGPSVVDANGARGVTAPVLIDGRTAANLDAPVSQCAQKDWDALFGIALFGRPPAGEPGAPAALMPAQAACIEGEPSTSGASGNAAMSPFAAHAHCADGEASGFAYVRGGLPDFRVGEAMSSFRIYRDPGRGIVARVESVARGIHLAGLVTIDSVRGVAESWANGRHQHSVEDGADYRANCDFERTAGTCFQRHIFGVRSPEWGCGPCGDEQAFLDGMKEIFKGHGEARFRNPDPVLARGLADGSAAAVVKHSSERFADMLVNQDLLQTVVPALEIIRFANPSHFTSTTDSNSPPGRQIYQFAGVEVGSTYTIQCLLVYDPKTNTCAAEAEAPAELKIQLTDAAEKPLAGGGFEIREDVDADGVLGLADKLVPDGACVTTDDGTGTCSFSALKPGAYVVSQVVAPPGYAPTKEPFPVELVSGESRTVVFTNTSSLSAVNITLEGEDGQPLSGGSFAIYPDPDADGKVAPDAQPAAKCDTAADGTCSMTVPAGSYVLVQTAAPDGLEPIEPVPFVISSGGQVAAVEAVNYPFGAPPEAAPAASPVFTYQPPPADLPPELHTVPLPTMGIPQDQPEAAPQEGAGAVVGNTVERIVRAPGDALRLLARSPAEAIAFAAAVLLFALACAAIDRRRKLLALTAAG